MTENWYSRATLLKLFGRLHHDSSQNEDLSIENLLNLLDNFETKSLQNKKEDMRKLMEGLDANAKQEVKERYGKNLYLKRTAKVCRAPWTLDRLPPEMIMQICDFADAKTLIALRRTCKIISQCALEPFCRAHFSERRHILSRHSLEELVNITAHPVFGPYVRTVKLGSCRLSANSFQNLDLLENDSDPEGSASLKKFKDVIYLTVHEQNSLENPGYGVQSSAMLWLQRALNNAHGWGNTPNLGTWADVSTHSSAASDPTYFASSEFENATFFSGWGSLKAYGSGLDAATARNYLTFEDRPIKTTKLLLNAAGGSECTVEALSLSIRTSEVSSWMMDEDTIPAQLSTIRSLTMNAYPVSSTARTVTDYSTMSFMERLIKHADNLVEWKLGGIGIRSMLEQLTPSLNIIKLHTLHLSDSDFDRLALREILETQRSTLKSLSLRSLKFYIIIDMQTLLLWMMDNLSLKTLIVFDLFARGLFEDITLPQSRKQATYDGEEQVREGLEELLAMLPSCLSATHTSTAQQYSSAAPTSLFAPRIAAPVTAATLTPTISSTAAPTPSVSSISTAATSPAVTSSATASPPTITPLVNTSSSAPALPTGQVQTGGERSALVSSDDLLVSRHAEVNQTTWPVGREPDGDSYVGLDSQETQTAISTGEELPSGGDSGFGNTGEQHGAWGSADLLDALPTPTGFTFTCGHHSGQAVQDQDEENACHPDPPRTPTLWDTRSNDSTPQHFADTGSQTFSNYIFKSKGQRLFSEYVGKSTGKNPPPDPGSEAEGGKARMDEEKVDDAHTAPTTDPSDSFHHLTNLTPSSAWLTPPAKLPSASRRRAKLGKAQL